MAGSIYDWSLTPDDNQTADADINWLENQLPGTVNGSARVMMERIAELRDDLGGALTPTGTANALTITANSAFTAYQQGLRIVIKAASTNTGAVTANVNGLGSKAIRKHGASADVALGAGDIVANGIFVLHYSTAANSAAGAWILIKPGSGLRGGCSLGLRLRSHHGHASRWPVPGYTAGRVWREPHGA